MGLAHPQYCRLSGCHGLHALHPPFATVRHGPGNDPSNRSRFMAYQLSLGLLVIQTDRAGLEPASQRSVKPSMCDLQAIQRSSDREYTV